MRWDGDGNEASESGVLLVTDIGTILIIIRYFTNAVPLYCQWHVLKSWKPKFKELVSASSSLPSASSSSSSSSSSSAPDSSSQVQDSASGSPKNTDADTLYAWAKYLLYIPSIYLFQLALIQFMRVLCTSGNDAIAKYFYTFYLAEGKYKLWASAYRCHWLAVNTNVPAESWHNQLQQYFMLTPLRQQLKYEYEALETLRRSEQYYYTRWYQHCRGFSAKRGTKFQKEQEQRRLRGAGIRTAVMYLQADN
jgi:hypothetical protein